MRKRGVGSGNLTAYIAYHARTAVEELMDNLYFSPPSRLVRLRHLNEHLRRERQSFRLYSTTLV